MSDSYPGPERRHNGVQLSEAQIDAIADRAADRALEKVYTTIGRSVVRKALWVIGAGVIALLAWLAGTGGLK